MALPTLRPAAEDGAALRSVPVQTRKPNLLFRSSVLLHIVALLFATATITYSVGWMYYVRLQTIVELGLDTRPAQNDTARVITSVEHDSPAETAGLKVGDQIIAVNGRHFTPEGPNVMQATWVHGVPGGRVILTIRRPGEQRNFNVEAIFRSISQVPSRLRRIADQIMGSFPIVFLVVGLGVLFLRVDDPHAWRLALLFACFVAVSDVPDAYSLAPNGLRLFLLAYRSIFLGLMAPLFLFVFSLFPTRSPLDRHAPWLKWAGVVTGLTIGSWGAPFGDLRFPSPLANALGASVTQYAILTFVFGTMLLGFAALSWNSAKAESIQAKRKIRVIVWGAFVGLSPALVAKVITNFFHVRIPVWEDLADTVLLCLFPLSFAYAVVKHQVLEIPALLKRSARYVLVKRGFVLLLLLLAILVNVLLAISLSRTFKMQSALAMAIGGGIGIALAWISARGLRRTTQRIDRAFFREAYDARMILQELAGKVRNVASREELAELIKNRLELALHPASLTVYVRTQEPVLIAASAMSAMPALSPQSPGLSELARVGEAVESSTFENLLLLVPELAMFHPECLVPVLGRTGELLALLVLGAKLSEEPYSREDKQLLGSVAGQAGLALDSISMAEIMAKRMEADLRAQREMQIAREVQSKLLPQQCPPLATLDYAGNCIQARAVGGDYYDFLDFGSGKVGLVLADIAGKGISGALLMANLQASLRSMYASAERDLPQFLGSVNRLFVKNTETTHYATMFFGVYDDASRKLLYANCGHNPPILLRHDGQVLRLGATATVLGLFEDWQCTVDQIALSAGEILAIYTDGITEAADRDEEEFGEERLISLLQSNKSHNAPSLLKKVLAAVQEFSPGEQGDDLTLIVAKVK